MTQSQAIMEQHWRDCTKQQNKAATRRRLAYHEAGHTAVFLYYGVSVAWADIHDRGGRAQNNSTDLSDEDWLTVLAAGGAAERRAGFDDGRCSHQDYLDAAQHSRSMSRAGSDAAWSRALDQASDLVDKQWPFISVCAQELMDRGELGCAEIARLWDEIGDKPDPGPWLAAQHANEPPLLHRDWTMQAAPRNRAEVELRYRPGYIIPPTRPTARPRVEDDDGLSSRGYVPAIWNGIR